MIIKTEYYPKPILDRRFDWDAWCDDYEDMVGHGLTEKDAIEDLKTQIYEAS